MSREIAGARAIPRFILSHGSSSDSDCAFDSGIITPPCIIGAVIMKMIISSIITSIRLTTLISALSTSRSAAPPAPALSSDSSLAYQHRDQLGLKLSGWPSILLRRAML